MISVFSREGEGMIAQVAADRALLALDFDGTLAPIVAHREHADMRPATRALLRAASALYPCVVVSGRARADVARRMAGVPVLAIAGNHGAELDDAPPDPRLAARVRAWAAALQEALARFPGVEIEVKGHSLAVHHRHADVGAAGTARMTALAATLPGARVFGGEEVVNVVPAESRTKGGAVEALAAAQGARTVLYVGDDVTDEDAFRSPAVAFPVRVGRAEGSAARYFLEAQQQIDDLLRALVAARGRHSQPGDASSAATSPAQRGGGKP